MKLTGEYPIPVAVWLNLILPDGLRQREKDRIARKIVELLAQGVVPEI